MVHKLFVDSDVIIDFFTDRKPHLNPASELFDLNEQSKVELYVSAVSISNIYYIIRRYLGHKKSLEVIEDLTNILEIIGTNKSEIIQALKNDFKDSIQYSTALTVKGIEAIIPGNVKDFRNSKIAVMTPLN
ncbi:MAG: PIN domain-containing protein [Bacteroidota bacterium]